MITRKQISKKRVAAYTEAMKLMGNRFEITVVAKDAVWASEIIAGAVEEIRRIEKLLTTYSEDSETSLINAAAGISPVCVSEETFQLIQRACRISYITQGAFDISYGSVDKRLWNFDQTMTSLPDEKSARRAVRLINYRNIILDETRTTVFLKEKGMRIGFGGIGKGYAAEMAKGVLKRMGVRNGIVNASGDLATWGRQPNGKPWTIGIVHPNLKDKIFSCFEGSELAVATSGNYEKFVVIGGKKFSHTIDPRTGLPVTGIKSVTVITTNAEIADAMATPVSVMGIQAGLHMINQIRNIEAVIIDDNDMIYTSKNLHFI